MVTQNTDLKASLKKFEHTLDEYFVKKAPFQLPDGVKEFIVAFGPWITVVLLALTLPIILAALGLSAVFAPFAALGGGLQGGYAWGIGTILTLVVFVLEIFALPGLFARRKSGWNLLFYASLVSILYNLAYFNLGGLVIGTLINWYLLFQVRSYYK